jgi:hypothetical protein
LIRQAQLRAQKGSLLKFLSQHISLYQQCTNQSGKKDK